jgi:hypothetical protein
MKVYVGYDSREDIAWQVCRHSLYRHADASLPVYPLRQSALRELGLYTRPLDAKASTEFSITRFLTPFLAAYEGWSIFTDCDFLFTTDIRKIMRSLDPSKAIHVVQHDYTPALAIKMDGKAQHVYPRKNWSSFIAFNGAHPSVKALTPDVVNAAEPAYLHRFNWVDDKDIGGLDLAWNFLVGEYPKPKAVPAAIHYTNGGPWFDNHVNVDYGDLWVAEREMYLDTAKAA